MAPDVNWGVIGLIAKGDPQDEGAIEEVIDIIQNINESDYRDDPEKLILLVLSARKALDYREHVFKEILQDHEVEVEEMRQELDEQKQLGSGAIPKDVDFYRAENRRLNEQKNAYHEQNEQLTQEISQVVEEKEKLEQEAESLRRMNKDMKTENQDLRMSLLDYQNIIDKQNNQRVSATGDIGAQEKLAERNKQVSELLSKITDLEKVNRDLEDERKKVRQEMESGQEDMEKMADEYEKMRKIINSSDKFSDNLQKQNAQLQLQVSDLLERVDAQGKEDDAISRAVNDKVEEWTARVQERDRENAEQARIIADLRSKMTSAALGHDRVQIDKLTKKLASRDAEVEELKNALNEAVNEMEEQTAIVEDLRRDQGTNREALAYRLKIKNLQSQIDGDAAAIKAAQAKSEAAEDDARETEIKLVDAMKRIALLESGQYGLTEAVNDIKDCKSVIRRRDDEIRNLIKSTNQLEEKINDFIEENEEFRERLGLEPRNLDDIVELRKNRALRQQQFRAENQILLKEIEALEEERLSLKKQIRRQAQSQMQRAKDEGLLPQDLELVDQFIDEVVRKRKQGSDDNSFVLPGLTVNLKKSRDVECSESAKMRKIMEIGQAENKKLQEESHQIIAENKSLRKAMSDLIAELKNPKESRKLVNIASLDRLVEVLEIKRADKYGDRSEIRSDMDQLIGRNDELRHELEKIRKELIASSVENRSVEKQNEELRNNMGALEKLAKEKIKLGVLNLPSDVEPQSVDVINALNEQLIEVLKDRDVSMNKVEELREALENSRRQLQVIRHQTHTLYQEHHAELDKKTQEKRSWEMEKEAMMEKVEKDAVKLDEYERLLTSLESSPDDVKRRLAETSRKVSLLRVNEKSLIRRHKAMEASEELMTSENRRLRNELTQMEKAVSERISYLDRYKTMAKFKLESLQKSLEASVPESEVSSLNRKFDDLTRKYRDLLQTNNNFVAKNLKVETLQEELKIATEASGALRGELAIEKEKRHALEEAMGKTNAGVMEASSSGSLFKKVTMLEMKELNERQRAEHASRMHARLKDAMDEVERRNQELETKFAELTRLHLEAQQTERELRDELTNAIPRSVSDADRRKISSLEEELAKAKVGMLKSQDMAEISHNQLHSVLAQQQARDREVKSLRQQVREFQVQTDEHALIGQLHHQILNLQASGVDTERKLDRAEKDVEKLEAHVLKLEKQIDEKDDSVYLIRVESNNKSKQLKKTIQSLRQQFSGALPLAQQEKFSNVMARLRGDKVMIQEELRRVRAEREKLEDKLAEAEIKKAGLEELRKAIKDGRGMDKLTEWSARMDKLRLQDMKLQRQVVRQGEQLKYLENLNWDHEKTITDLEEDIVELLKAQEDHQVEWEVREMELERLLDQLQSRQRDVSRKAKRLEEVTKFLPDPSLSISDQLSQALDVIRDQSKITADLKGHNKALQFENDRLKDIRHNLESDVTSRDRVINELRLHMPTTTSSAMMKNMTQDTDTTQQLRVAMETVDTLKKRLAAKEESLARHKQLVEEARRDQEVASSNHERELIMMQQKLHQRTDDAFSRFKSSAPSSSPPRRLSSREVSHISELQDMVKEQDAAMTALMDRVRAANADVNKQKQLIASSRRQHEVERNKLLEEQESSMNSIRVQLAKKQRMVEGLEKELSVTREDLQREREANSRSPMNTMKRLVAKLKLQLQEKEKQQQKLSHALTELRGDLVEQAQENVRAQHVSEADSHSVKLLVEKRTSKYKEELEDMKDKLAEQQRAMKQAKKTEETLRGELKKILEENERKEQTIRRLKLELRGKDADVGQLRGKVKRLVKSRDLLDEEPVRLEPKTSKSSSDEVPVVEELVLPTDAAPQEGSRPSSARPRSTQSKSLADSSTIDNLRREVESLKTENENLKEKLKAQEPTKSTLEVAKWDARKQWQSKVDQLRKKLVEKEKEIETFEKQVTALRDTVSRLEREKSRRGVSSIGPPIHAQGTSEESVAPRDHAARQHLHKIEELSRRVHQLSEENSELRHSVMLPRDKMSAEVQEQNRILSGKLEGLEKEILESGSNQNVDVSDHFRSRENELEGRILKLSSNNAQLLFEIEQSKLRTPRLMERLEYQQKYIELLQSEKKEAQLRANRVKGQPDKKVSGQGSSGKSVVELEKTVALMKRVVERVQRENDELKKAPGVVSNQQLDELRAENRILKNRVHEMTQQIGGQLSKRYEAKTQSVEKLVSEIDRLKSEVGKHVTAKKKMRKAKENMQSEKEKILKEVEDLKRKLADAQSKAPKLAGAGRGGYNSVVTSRMLEAKLNKVEEELGKRNQENEALKAVMRDKYEEERRMKENNKQLQEQVEILERFPPGAGGVDANTVRELQLARLAMARLESEKEELRHQVEVLQRTSDSHPHPSQTLDDDVKYRSEIIRLETDLKVKEEEKRNMEVELKRMQVELSHFDGNFFDEIEDLKYNYAQSMKKNVLYEEQLRALSRQFGVQVDVAGSDSD